MNKKWMLRYWVVAAAVTAGMGLLVSEGKETDPTEHGRRTAEVWAWEANEEKSFCGRYAADFGPDEEAELEILYADGEGVCCVIFSGASGRNAEYTEGFLVPDTDGAGRVWDCYDLERHQQVCRVRYDGQDRIRVSAVTGHRHDGRRFSGTYTRVEEYPMRFNGEETVAIKKYPIRRIACNGQGIKKGRISISFFFGTTHIISLPWQFIHVGRKKLKVIAK